jgi:hypothetical protein
MKDYKPANLRMQAAFLILDIIENESVMKGRKTFRGMAQLERVYAYLIETEDI